MKYAVQSKTMTVLLAALLIAALSPAVQAQDPAAAAAAAPAPVAPPAAPAAPAAAPAPADAAFKVFPADINLETSRDNQTFVVQVTQPDGVTRDVTAEAQVSLADPKLAKLEGNVLTPLADGQTNLVVA